MGFSHPILLADPAAVGDATAGSLAWGTGSGSAAQAINTRMPWESGQQQAALILERTTNPAGDYPYNWTKVIVDNTLVASGVAWAVPAGMRLRITALAYSIATAAAGYGSFGARLPNVSNLEVVEVPFEFAAAGSGDGQVSAVNQELTGQVNAYINSTANVNVGLSMFGFLYTP